ncbi:MAG: aldehyde dehydrogenase [Dehalococcoidales bacterium]|nr:aldehyde dehydrogenase [Dehalococcoidales bacterium]
MDNYKMWIAGQWVDAGSKKTYPAVNPATEEEIATVPLGDKADVDKAVAAAKKAYPVWSKKSQAERNMILARLADILLEYTEELGNLECIDHGFPIGTAREMSGAPSGCFRGAIETAKRLAGDIAPRRSDALVYTQLEPIGVCALITPWNIPLTIGASQMANCIAAGNTCVLKPPSVDSLSLLTLGKALERSELPTGTVNIVTGPGSTVGEALSAHPDVWKVHFVGSTETGRRIMEVGSCNVKRMSLELGGKNPFIVLDDADVGSAVECAMRNTFFNSGQTCASTGRYYIHEKIYDEFVRKFTEAAKKLVVGNPLDAKTQMGPMASKEHRDKVEGYIKSGREEGARLVLGGERPAAPPLNRGYFVMPTIFTHVKQSMKIAREEIFGPVACIMEPFSSDDEVIELANDNRFQLGASVWTPNISRAIRFVNEVQAGGFYVNEHGVPTDGMPWGGFKESGFGKQGCLIGMEEFTQMKAVYINTSFK